MKCPFCQQELPTEAKFCNKCEKQIICIECGKELIPASTLCVFCGTPINIQKNSNNTCINQFEYKEDINGKSFKASFTNETAGNVVETLAQILPSSAWSHRHKTLPQYTNAEEITEDPTVPVTSIKEQENLLSDNDSSHLSQVFKYRGGKLYLHESRLKANSKSDYAGRLTILYLYYKYINGEAEVSRAETNDFLKGEGFNNDGNYRKWISNNKSLYNIDNNNYCLCQEGIERAKEYLSDIFDEAKVDT